MTKDLAVAPTVSPMPAGLPDPRKAPDDGEWKDKDGKMRFAGTFLPSPLDAEIVRRLALLEQMPEVVQVQIDQLLDLGKKEGDGRVAVAEARCIAERISEGPRIQKGWSTWQVLGVVMIAVGLTTGAVSLAWGLNR